jgi:O-antigen/teichoic acid export membrane protein
VLKNFLTLATGEFASRGIQAVAFLLLTRALGKAALSDFGFAIAVTSYVLIAVQQGFDTVAIREIARTPAGMARFTGNIFGLRLALASLAVALTVAFSIIGGREIGANQLLMILSVTYIANALTPRWSFLAVERARPLAVAGLISQSCFLGGVLLVHSPSQMLTAAMALVAGESLAGAYLWRAFARQYGSLEVHLDWPFSKWIFRQSWPMSVSLLLGNMLYNFDVVALKGFGRGAEIGLYVSCYRCITVFAPVLAALQVSILPSLARAYPKSVEIRRRVTWLSLLTFGPLAIASYLIMTYARQILVLLFGREFGEGAPILQILAWALPALGVRGILRQALLAFHLQSFDTRNLAYGVAVNAGLDVLLIPRWGAAGCAVSTLMSEVVLCVASQIVISRKIR